MIMKMMMMMMMILIIVLIVIIILQSTDPTNFINLIISVLKKLRIFHSQV
jgi:FtsH-binding integral membrane protein